MKRGAGARANISAGIRAARQRRLEDEALYVYS